MTDVATYQFSFLLMKFDGNFFLNHSLSYGGCLGPHTSGAEIKHFGVSSPSYLLIAFEICILL